ncbi:hypothetical protein [Pseudorhodoferax sp.]|uniref:hypothetical protein n=1 Tax=Pseudorhodoferax sp. TaxID=1993553 RepID=UPI001B518327|nr:hypothetical protein [Pseudorhodoferax sp.]MBP8144639.1 hypothetical protein [Inhella sp.]
MKDDSDWCALLRDDGPEPADAGFSLRVMAALTLRRRRPPRSDPAPARAAELLAMGSSCAALALLMLQGPGGVEQLAAGAVLLGLLLWWSLPQSRGSQWR